MRKFRLWKEFRTAFISSSKKRGLGSFFEEELPDSRRIACSIIKEKPIRIIMQKNVKRSNTNV